MELKKNWNSNGNIAGGDRLQLLGFCLGQTYKISPPRGPLGKLSTHIPLQKAEKSTVLDIYHIFNKSKA